VDDAQNQVAQGNSQKLTEPKDAKFSFSQANAKIQIYKLPWNDHEPSACRRVFAKAKPATEKSRDIFSRRTQPGPTGRQKRRA
jgi:hypothetical protein